MFDNDNAQIISHQRDIESIDKIHNDFRIHVNGRDFKH